MELDIRTLKFYFGTHLDIAKAIVENNNMTPELAGDCREELLRGLDSMLNNNANSPEAKKDLRALRRISVKTQLTLLESIQTIYDMYNRILEKYNPEGSNLKCH